MKRLLIMIIEYLKKIINPDSDGKGRISPQLLVDSDDEKRILVYRIHHLDQKKEDEKKELLNIRRLDLKETLPSSKVSIIERQV